MDYYHEETFDEDAIFFVDKTPEEIYQAFSKKGGWSTKDVEISQMISKKPLRYYLEKGFKILYIKV